MLSCSDRVNVLSLRLVCPWIVLGAAASARAEIDYHVKVDPVAKQVDVSITVPPAPGPLGVQIPNWMPGHYVLDFYRKDIHDVTAYDQNGAALAVEHPDANTWTVAQPTGPVTFRYWVPIGAAKRFTLPNDDSFVQIAGAANYMYVLGRKTERCKVSYDLPSGWMALTGLDKKGHEPNTFTAPTYDVLADNPLSTGAVLVDHYKVRGKDEFVVLEGASKDNVDRQRMLQYCRFVSTIEADFFRGVPYHKYVWHFIVPGGVRAGGGGLEHLSSTQITLSPRLNSSAISLLAHEHFHLWNVKRIRAKVLGPFDYLNLPKTGNLWWLEGVTDYYAGLLPYRYGEIKRDRFLNTAAQHANQIQTNPARLTVSPYQSSYRLSEAPGAVGGTGSNGGYLVNFYTSGWLCGMCLDTEIRYQTHGKRSLDDVIRSLFDECKNDKPGFEEDEIRRLCIKFGGPSLGPFYDKIVMMPGELPVADQLAKVGLIMEQVPSPAVVPALITDPGPAGEAILKSVPLSAQSKLMYGDQIVAVDGQQASAQNRYAIYDLLNDYSYEGHSAPVALTLTRSGQTVNVTIEPVSKETKVWVVKDDPRATKDAIDLRDKWLAVKKIAIQ